VIFESLTICAGKLRVRGALEVSFDILTTFAENLSLSLGPAVGLLCCVWVISFDILTMRDGNLSLRLVGVFSSWTLLIFDNFTTSAEKLSLRPVVVF